MKSILGALHGRAARVALGGVGLLVPSLIGAVASGALTAPTSSAQAACSASYSVASQWSGGFNWVVTVTAGPVDITGWTVTWSYANGQTVSYPYNAVVTQSGAGVSATNESYNGSLAAGASTQFGGGGTWSGTNSIPTLSCTSTGSSPTTTTVGTTTIGSTTTTTVGPTTTTGPGSTTTTGAGATGPLTPPTTTFPSGPYTGNATYFSSVGSPYGGCGLPGANIDTQNYLALNVQNTPGNYSTDLSRPIPAADESEIGMFDNGQNCDRWVHVSIGNYCTGTNDGAPNEPFCRDGSWVADQYNGASLDFVVADSCQDGNAWCRDDPYHVDLHQSSLTQFMMTDGQLSSGLPDKWNNRQVSWSFEPAPNYSGDINIGFLQGAGPYWTAIAVSHLQNGIHGVDYLSNGTWTAASMDADMGDDYVILPTTPGGTSYDIRVYDANNQLINGGRNYLFSFPSSCGTQCSAAYTPVTYTTTTTAPSTTTTTAPSTTTTTAPSTTTTTALNGATCSASYTVTDQWSGGFIGNVTVTAGPAAISSWKVTWSFSADQSVTNVWDANLSQSGSSVTATNTGYNGSLTAGTSTQWGFEGSGSGAGSVPVLSCT